MRWLLTALKQIWSVLTRSKDDTIKISTKLFDDIEELAPGIWRMKRRRTKRKRRG